MDAVLNITVRVAPSKATILIRDESGTGKELIAKAVHVASPRKNKPLVIMNVAAFNEGTLESELFGHEDHLPSHSAANSDGLTGELTEHYLLMKLRM